MDLSERRRQALADVFEVITTKGDPREVIDAIYARIEHPALRFSDSDHPRGAVSDALTEADLDALRGAVSLSSSANHIAGAWAAIEKLERTANPGAIEHEVPYCPQCGRAIAGDGPCPTPGCLTFPREAYEQAIGTDQPRGAV